jgi:nitrite reductase/ring-hydroxylating ferredoxin subunit
MTSRAVKRYAVAKTVDVPPGARVIVVVARRSIGIYNVRGRYYAIRNHCPHQGGPLCRGTTSGLTKARFIEGAAPEVEIEREGEIVKCPWHGWQFDLRTGSAVFGEGVRVAIYKTYGERIASAAVDGDDFVDVEMAPAVETYRTSVEGGLVIVEIPTALRT